MAICSNKTRIFVGLLMGISLLTTGCAPDYISEELPSIDVPIKTGSIATGAASTASPENVPGGVALPVPQAPQFLTIPPGPAAPAPAAPALAAPAPAAPASAAGAVNAAPAPQ